jgi:hypothetical protein
MSTLNLSKYGVKKINNKSQKEISGGVYWWAPAALAIAYNEVNDIWESGGDNLREAYQDGQEWAKNN